MTDSRFHRHDALVRASLIWVEHQHLDREPVAA